MWFDPKGSKSGKKAAGRIEYRLEHIRLSLPQNEKKNTINKKIPAKLLTTEDIPNTIENLESNEKNFPVMQEFMITTRSDRIEMIKCEKSFMYISEKFTPIIHYKGRFVSTLTCLI